MSEMPLSNCNFYAFVHKRYDNRIFLTIGLFFGGCKFASDSLLLFSLSHLSPAPQTAALTGHLEDCNKFML